MADPVSGQPEELIVVEPPARETALGLLRGRRDFRRLFLAVGASELGDALHYIALMWVALEAGGPLGVMAVRLADSIPAIVFGFHGGVAADRWSRKRMMVSADLARGAVLVPVAVAGLFGELPLWGLVLAAFLLETATSYFAPAYGAMLPAVVDRRNVQQANALVTSTAQAVSVGGWALAAGLLAFLPLSAFFALNAASFFVSALLIGGVRRTRADRGRETAPRVREGLAALRPLPALAAAVAVLAVVKTISSGTWIGGVPTLVRDTLGQGAGAYSLVMVGYALGSIAGGIALTRIEVRRKAVVSLLLWTLYLPAYGLMAMAGGLMTAAAGAFAAGLGQSSSVVLLNAAAQEDVPDRVLGRVMGLISLVHRGSHATGLLLVTPLFAVAEPQSLFAASALAIPLTSLGGALLAVRAARRSSSGGEFVRRA
jgi:MFS family permease